LRQFRENDKADVKDRHCLAPLVLKRTTLPVGQRDPKANGLPQERRKNRYRLMSALGQKQNQLNVRFTPKSRHSLTRPACPLCAKSGHSALRQRLLFDHLVGAGE